MLLAPSWLSLSQGIIAGDVDLLVTGVSEAERTMSDDERNEQEQERPRPRVVDKRVGSNPSSATPTEASSPTPPPAAEVPPPADPAPPVSAVPDPEPQAAAPGPGGQVWTPEQEAEARRMAEEIAATPSLEWVVNTAVSLANIAATKLDLGDPADAALAIDALAGILDKVGDQLQNVEQPLRQTLAQLQMAYAERVTQQPPTTPSAT